MGVFAQAAQAASQTAGGNLFSNAAAAQQAAPATPQPVTTTAGTTITPGASPLGNYASGVSNAFSQGVAQIKSAFTPSTDPNPVVPLEKGAQLGAGAVEAATSPLAPLFSPLGKLIGYVSDKISNSPTVQKFANSPAGEVTSRAAQDVENLSTIAGAATGSEGSAPVESALDTATSKVADTGGNLAAQGLGMTTGVGASSIKEAFNGSQAFTDAMRGKIDPESVVQTAQNAVQNIADNRRQTYISQLGEIGKNTKSLDISPVQNALHTQLVNFGVKVNDDGSLDFGRSSIANNGTARADIQGVYDTLKTWGTKPGDRTAVGLDTLKKQLSDFYSPSGSARALVQSVKGKVSNILNTQVPGYQDMTAGYAKATNLLDDIKSATGVGGKAKVDTIFTKMTTALKGDKELRLEVMKQMQADGAQPDLMSQIAGTNMQSFVPKGLVGRGTDVYAAFALLGHFFQPQYIPMLLSTSPRVVGEFVRTLGMSKNAVSAIVGAVNKGAAKAATGSLGAAPQASLSQAPKQSLQ